MPLAFSSPIVTTQPHQSHRFFKMAAILKARVDSQKDCLLRKKRGKTLESWVKKNEKNQLYFINSKEINQNTHPISPLKKTTNSFPLHFRRQLSQLNHTNPIIYSHNLKLAQFSIKITYRHDKLETKCSKLKKKS